MAKFKVRIKGFNDRIIIEAHRMDVSATHPAMLFYADEGDGTIVAAVQLEQILCAWREGSVAESQKC